MSGRGMKLERGAPSPEVVGLTPLKAAEKVANKHKESRVEGGGEGGQTGFG